MQTGWMEKMPGSKVRTCFHFFNTRFLQVIRFSRNGELALSGKQHLPRVGLQHVQFPFVLEGPVDVCPDSVHNHAADTSHGAVAGIPVAAVQSRSGYFARCSRGNSGRDGRTWDGQGGRPE